jgi:hypothetical protein
MNAYAQDSFWSNHKWQEWRYAKNENIFIDTNFSPVLSGGRQNLTWLSSTLKSNHIHSLDKQVPIPFNIWVLTLPPWALPFHGFASQCSSSLSTLLWFLLLCLLFLLASPLLSTLHCMPTLSLWSPNPIPYYSIHNPVWPFMWLQLSSLFRWLRTQHFQLWVYT